MSSSSSLNPDPSESYTEHTWSVRVLPNGTAAATTYCRNHAFHVHKQASFDTADPQPSALEYLLGSFAADLVIGLEGIAAQRGLELEDVEASLTVVLNNPLVFLGVLGEEGETGITAIHGTVYVHADDPARLEPVWQETLRRSPLYNTLKRCIKIEIQLQQTL